MDLIDYYEKYKENKHNLTKAEREKIVKKIVNTDAYTTSILSDIALEEDLDCIIYLSIKIESDNVPELLIYNSILTKKQIDVLVNEIFKNKRYISQLKEQYEFCIHNDIEINNKEIIEGIIKK